MSVVVEETCLRTPLFAGPSPSGGSEMIVSTGRGRQTLDPHRNSFSLILLCHVHLAVGRGI